MLDPLTDDVIAELAGSDAVYYLASPYSLYAGGLDAAALVACRAAAALLSRHVSLFSPIAHDHPVAEAGGLDQRDHEFWMKHCRRRMEKMDGLIVVQAPGWQTSRGVAEEIAFFRESCLPIYGMPHVA